MASTPTTAKAQETEGAMLSFAADPRSRTTMTEEQLQLILKEVRSDPNITGLSLRGNVIPLSTVSTLSDFLRTDRQIKHLDLAMCALGNTGALSIIRAISFVKPPRRGSVTAIQTQRESATDAARDKVHRLDLSLNYLTLDGMPAIAQALRQPTCSITHLILRYNSLTAHGVASVMRFTCTVAVLDCRYCAVDLSDPMCISHLSQGIEENTSIHTLQLDGNAISGAEMRVLQEAARSNHDSKLLDDHGGLRLSHRTGTLPLALADFLDAHRRRAGVASNDVYNEVEKIDGSLGAITIPRAATSAQRDSKARGDGESATPHSARYIALNCDAPPSLARSGDRSSSVTMPRSRSNHRSDAMQSAAAANSVTPYAAQQTPREKSRSPRRGRSEGSVVPRLDFNNISGQYTNTPSSHRNTSLLPGASKSGPRSSAGFHSSRLPTDDTPLLSKGRVARMLLNRCAIDTAQCEFILGADVFQHLKRGGGNHKGCPSELTIYSALPAVLQELPSRSHDRLHGLAKLLHFVLSGPVECERFESEEEILQLFDFPPELTNEAAIRSYRMQRMEENTMARRVLTDIMQKEATAERGRSQRQRLFQDQRLYGFTLEGDATQLSSQRSRSAAVLPPGSSSARREKDADLGRSASRGRSTSSIGPSAVVAKRPPPRIYNFNPTIVAHRRAQSARR